MEQANQSNTARKENKGFTVMVGDTYVGYLVINEKRAPVATVKNLQQPANMAAVLAQAELRPFEDAKEHDTSSLDAIMAGASS